MANRTGAIPGKDGQGINSITAILLNLIVVCVGLDVENVIAIAAIWHDHIGVGRAEGDEL